MLEYIYIFIGFLVCGTVASKIAAGGSALK
jgi:hypothetical protein